MSRPRLKLDGDLIPGIVGVGLFVAFGAVFVSTHFGAPQGFGTNPAVMKSLGAALFGFDPGAVVGEAGTVPAENFIVAFEIIDLALVAALVGAVMLARRDSPSDVRGGSGGGK